MNGRKRPRPGYAYAPPAWKLCALVRRKRLWGAGVVLTTPQEVETWMTAPPDEALMLQRPLPDGSLRIVARGVKEDEVTLP